MPAKITLSKQEMDLVCDADIILTKNRIMEKAFDLLSRVQDDCTSMVLQNVNKLPTRIMERGAKISKGENYRGLPYLVLDFPRIFGKADTFAIRIMFWWGNFFSITLQLSGIYKDEHIASVRDHFNILTEAGFLSGVSDDPWQHHFEPTNYRMLTLDEFNKITANASHLKIAAQLPVEKWNDADDWMKEKFGLLLNIISFRYDERVL